MRRFRCALIAELSKATTLPAIAGIAGGTIGAGVVIMSMLTAADPNRSLPDRLSVTVGFLQVGMVLLGIAAVTQDCGPGQVRTTLMAVPRRRSLLAAKTVSFIVSCSAVALLAVASCVVVAWCQAGPRGLGFSLNAWAQSALAVSVLLAIGMLSFGVTLLTQSGTVALVVMLALVALLPTVLSGYPAVVQWLPTKAGQRVYAETPGEQSSLREYVVLGSWVAVAAGLGCWRFARSDGC